MQILTNSAVSTPVQILDSESFQIIFATAYPMRVTVADNKTATKFQVENGETRSDHVVKNAIELTIDFILIGDDSRNQFDNIHQAYADNKLVSVQTKMKTYENMLIVGVPHDETPAVYDGASMPVQFQEWREIQPEYGELQQKKVAKPAQSSTAPRGKQTGSDASPSEKKRSSSVLGGWARSNRDKP